MPLPKSADTPGVTLTPELEAEVGYLSCIGTNGRSAAPV